MYTAIDNIRHETICRVEVVLCGAYVRLLSTLAPVMAQLQPSPKANYPEIFYFQLKIPNNNNVLVSGNRMVN